MHNPGDGGKKKKREVSSVCGQGGGEPQFPAKRAVEENALEGEGKSVISTTPKKWNLVGKLSERGGKKTERL